ncbi:MAG: hypothetical protein ACI8W8_002056, partial [Rhodothermales bacterium]
MHWEMQHPDPSRSGWESFARLYTRHAEHWSDEGHGSCRMADPASAEIVANALSHFDDQRYELIAYVIIPNHVHRLAACRASALGRHWSMAHPLMHVSPFGHKTACDGGSEGQTLPANA